MKQPTDEELIGKVRAELCTGAPGTADWPNLAIALAARLEAVSKELEAVNAEARTLRRKLDSLGNIASEVAQRLEDGVEWNQ